MNRAEEIYNLYHNDDISLAEANYLAYNVKTYVDLLVVPTTLPREGEKK